MTVETITTQNTTTREAIQQTLELLRSLAEQKPDQDDTGKTNLNSLLNPDILKTIEAALKSVAETKSKPKAAPAEDNVEDDEEDEEAECAGNEENDEDDEDDENNPFAGTYYWNPGPEWKTIGLVAGGAALVGLGALLYKLFDD